MANTVATTTFCTSPSLPCIATRTTHLRESKTVASLASRDSSGARFVSLGGRVAQKSRKKYVLGPRCMAVDVQDNEQDNVNSQQQESSSLDPLEEISPSVTLDPRRDLEERFAVLNTGKHECRSCGHVYDENKGDMSYPISAGTTFLDLPGDWRCPTCGAAKSYFQSKSVEVAGFAQNQQFGLGGNSLTAGQKSILIYGSLLAFFALFLSGYFLQ